MKKNIIKNTALLIFSCLINNAFAKDESSNLEVNANVEAGCHFQIDSIVAGTIPVEEVDLIKRFLFKPFNIKARCSPGTQYKIYSNDKATIEVQDGMEFVYMYPSKPDNKDYMGFHIGRHKIDPMICNDEINNGRTGIVYSSFRESFQQHSDHVASGQWDTLPMCIYFYLPSQDRANKNYNHYLTPDTYSTNYNFIFEY